MLYGVHNAYTPYCQNIPSGQHTSGDNNHSRLRYKPNILNLKHTCMEYKKYLSHHERKLMTRTLISGQVCHFLRPYAINNPIATDRQSKHNTFHYNFLIPIKINYHHHYVMLFIYMYFWCRLIVVSLVASGYDGGALR